MRLPAPAADPPIVFALPEISTAAPLIAPELLASPIVPVTSVPNELPSTTVSVVTCDPRPIEIP